MKKALVFDENNNFLFLVCVSILTLLMASYLTYSISKFNILRKRSLVKSNVVMKVIQHNVKSVCPHCGTKGLPTCPKCMIPMHWNGYRGTFICSSCGQGGFPQCPRCTRNMTWIESK